MTEQDRGPFAELMLAVGEFYGEAVSDVRLELFFRALSDLPLDGVKAAAAAHLRTSRFFPKPVELREAIEGPVDDRAEIAWAAVQSLVRRHGFYAKPEAIDWPDDVTKHAALKLYGGWQALCANLPATGPEMLGTAKLFKAHYAAVSRQVARQEALPPSHEEAKALLEGLKAELAERGLSTGAL